MKNYKELIGTEITQARKKLGYWWICTHCHVNYSYGWYTFERAPTGRVELQTKDNVVISEQHSAYAEMLLKRDNEKTDKTADEIAYERYKTGLDTYEDYLAVCTVEECEPLPR